MYSSYVNEMFQENIKILTSSARETQEKETQFQGMRGEKRSIDAHKDGCELCVKSESSRVYTYCRLVRAVHFKHQ